MNTVYPIFFDSWTSGNFLATFINKHFNINDNSGIFTVKNDIQGIRQKELYNHRHIFSVIDKKIQRMNTWSRNRLLDTIEIEKLINFEKGIEIEKYSAPYLFHEPLYFDSSLIENDYCIVKPILIYWEPEDKFMVNRQIDGHNIKVIENYINLEKQKEIKSKFEKDNIIIFRLQKLLEEDINTYRLLCDYINEKPLKNWVETIQEYKTNVNFDLYNTVDNTSKLLYNEN
jgi:hypothetical protein